MADVVDELTRSSRSDEGAAQLRAKGEFEDLLLENPEDSALRRGYFETLIRLSRQFSGLLEFRWPGYPYPLYFRCGSTDLHNFAQIFLRQEYDFPVPFVPRRILDLGAYVGYAAIFLAQRFPEADIVSVEPSAENFRLLVMNTAPYSRIRRVNAAVWGESGRMTFSLATPGDWGKRVVEGAHEGDVTALSLKDILRLARWNDVDLLKCDIEGAEKEVFNLDGASIARSVACCAVELHDASVPGCEAAVSSCFDSDMFERTRSGEYHIFTRHSVERPAPHVPAICVLRPEIGVRPISLLNVPSEEWGYYTFDGDSCQLNATSGNCPAAQLITMMEFAGQDAFECELFVENPLGYGVTFGFKVCDPDDNVLASASVDVAAGKGGRWICPIGAQSGLIQVFLSARMITGSPTNHQVRAYWRRPRFLKQDKAISTALARRPTRELEEFDWVAM
jgi:FkbM family methyltransferase